MSCAAHSPSQDLESAFISACRQDLPELRGRLHGILEGREDRFMDLGERIQYFAAAAEEISRKASELALKASGRLVSEFSAALDHKIREMTSQCSSLTGTRNTEDLTRVIGAVENLQHFVAGFRRIIRRLEMLGISTRIESARLGQDGLGFHTLADDVQKLADRIEEYADQIGERSGRLTELAGSAIVRTEKMRKVQEDCSAEIFAVLQRNIAELQALMHSSEELSRALAPQAKEIATHFSEIVSSLQFHDITRQQVEHVEEALLDVIGVIENDASGAETTPLGEIVVWIAHVAELQASQLSNATQRFVNAVERIKESLIEVANAVAGLKELAGDVAGRDDQGGDSVLARIEASISKIVHTMHFIEEQGGDMGKVMISVADTVANMVGFVEEIENVGAEIELIAINASIKAARTGDKGRALGVLATSIQILSKEAGVLTEDVAKELHAIADASKSLKLNAQSYVNATHVEGLVKELTGLMQGMREVDRSVVALFRDIDAQSRELAGSVHAAAMGIDFHRGVAGELEAVRILCEAKGAEARSLDPDRQYSIEEGRLRMMLARYTMEAERKVHSVLAGQPHEEAAEATPSASLDPETRDGETWDNVELF